MIGFAAVILLIAAVGFGALWWRMRGLLEACRRDLLAARSERSTLGALLEAGPVAGFRWAHGTASPEPLGPAAARPGRGDYTAFVALLDNADAARLESAVEKLRHSAVGFSAAVSLTTGASYALDGRALPGGDGVLWLIETTAASRAEQARLTAATASVLLREDIDALPVPVWRRDANARLIDCNSAYAAAVDATREEALAEQRALVPHRPDAIVGGEPHTEQRHVVVSGSRRLLEISVIPLRDGGAIGYALDRTEVENAKSELARHTNAHREVLESIHAAVAIYGPDKRLQFCNSAFAGLWGIESDWLATEPSLDELLEQLRERRRIPEFADFRQFKRQQLQMFTSLIEPQTELMHLPDGRTLSVAISPHPLGGLIFVYEDVTDRLALERSYNTLIEVQRETLDNLFEGIAVFGSDGRLKLHNPAYRKIWALDRAYLAGEPHIGEIVEKTRAFYAGPDDQGDDDGNWPAIKDRVIAEITAQTPVSGPLHRKDGSILQLSTVPLPDGNVLVTCLDVTDTVRVERALRERNDALETAGRLKSEFIANVSYELRTPLNAIIGFAEILTNQYFGTLTPRQLDYSRGILDSSHRLLSLINDILDLATIEAGYMVLEPSEIDVADLLDSVITLTRERARNQHLTLTAQCPADVGPLEADERRLKQALFNLISNAIKFTPPHGSIHLEARREGDTIVFSVSDTGVGIPEAEQERVFEKFERVDPNARESGPGLGLSLVKSLIELHGGTVMIASRPGSGTTIECRLPSHPSVSPALQQPGQAAGN